METLAHAILTSATCGDGCWHARDIICRCSCFGKNHGILNQGGIQPGRTAKHDGELYELAAVIQGRQEGECWNDVFNRIDAEKKRLYDERFPEIDVWNYGDWGKIKTLPVLARKVQESHKKWKEVSVIPDAVYLIWSRPAGSEYVKKTEEQKAKERKHSQIIAEITASREQMVA